MDQIAGQYQGLEVFLVPDVEQKGVQNDIDFIYQHIKTDEKFFVRQILEQNLFQDLLFQREQFLNFYIALIKVFQEVIEDGGLGFLIEESENPGGAADILMDILFEIALNQT